MSTGLYRKCWQVTVLFGILITVLLIHVYYGSIGKTSSLQESPVPRIKTDNPEQTLSKYVWRQCQKEPTVVPPKHSRISPNILVDDKHKMLFCYVPKVASSNWRRVLLVLTGRLNATKVLDINPHKPPYSKWPLALGRFNPSGIEYRLKNYYKVMFVRNPFERLLSAWRNKFVTNSTSSIRFRRKYVERIVRQFQGLKNRSREEKGVVDKIMIRFDEFLHYIVDRVAIGSGTLNEHWDFYHRLCSPCSVRYDFVGKYETLEEDVAHVLKYVNAEHEFRFPLRSLNYHYDPTSVYINEYYKSLPVSVFKQVFELYKTDFILFNYSVPDDLKL